MPRHKAVLEEEIRLATPRSRAQWERGKESLNQAKQKSEQTIHEHPFESVGIAFAVGIVVGVLIGRR